MRRLPNWMIGFLLLAAGIAIGSGWQSLHVTRSVEANTLTAQEAERLYNELGSGENPLNLGSQRLAKIAALTTPSVVHIQSVRTNSSGTVEETGSGVIVSHPRFPGEYVVTNRHVIADAQSKDISIHLHDGRVLHPARVWIDAESDLAVMRITAAGLRPARFGDSDEVAIGDMVLAMGSPFGLSQSVTFGIISAKGRRSLQLGPDGAMLNQDFLQTDAAINPGNSGGPLIDLSGRIIGINTAIASNSGGNEGIGFSIPSSLVQMIVGELLEHGRVRRAYLGVKLDPDFDASAAARLSLDRPRGARVVQIYPDTPAQQARLEPNDVILRFDGRDVLDEDHLINLVSLTPVGARIRLVVLRSGRELAMQVLLADRTDLQQMRQRQSSSPNQRNTPLRSLDF